MHSVKLACHPDSHSEAVRSIDVEVRRAPEGMLSVSYVLRGDIDRVRVPQAAPPRFADRLWQHTCCELFVKRVEEPAYHELNFSPSGEWAVYAFSDYRERLAFDPANFDPTVRARTTGETLELEAAIDLRRCSEEYVRSTLALGISAVVEDGNGALSYWTLAHAPGRPDFHDPRAFALTLT